MRGLCSFERWVVKYGCGASSRLGRRMCHRARVEAMPARPYVSPILRSSCEAISGPMPITTTADRRNRSHQHETRVPPGQHCWVHGVDATAQWGRKRAKHPSVNCALDLYPEPPCPPACLLSCRLPNAVIDARNLARESAARPYYRSHSIGGGREDARSQPNPLETQQHRHDARQRHPQQQRQRQLHARRRRHHQRQP